MPPPATITHAEAIASLLAVLREQRTFLITSHARPDGDAIGSSLGLMHLLQAMGKDVTVAFADPIPQSFHRLPGVDCIVHSLPLETPDVAILLECDRVQRTGFDAIDARRTINIDHHLSGREFADYNWIDVEAPAVGAMIYDLAVVSGLPITPAIATCLYAAVLTDTGSFTYGITTAATFGLAQHLVESGADVHRVTQDVYFSNSPSKLRLLGIALARMHIEGPVAWSWVSEADLAEADAVIEDCEGVVNFLIGISGIWAAAFLREVPGGEFRISLRSKDSIDVASVATRFAGGGHRNASGGSLSGPIDTAVSHVTAALHHACATAGVAAPVAV